ncbi:hypothetical protein [Saccharothrix sp. ALI-22-I]|uniref:hypothetical protein n=1 Tax=Saccharothrix sp. ALI-22-I TaxID=1933778 RepID=UPI00117AE2D2|nr:hypothetical protein [Saccharothrix sp. ALI-22-I]
MQKINADSQYAPQVKGLCARSVARTVMALRVSGRSSAETTRWSSWEGGNTRSREAIGVGRCHRSSESPSSADRHGRGADNAVSAHLLDHSRTCRQAAAK